MANVLVVGPHPDDQELGMGGTIALLAAQGHDVVLLDMTDGEPTPYGDPVTRAAEAQAAAEVLSPPDHPIRRMLLGLPNRRVEHSLEARHAVAGVIRAHQAEIVFVPHPEDAHPDHVAVTRIVEDARFDAKLTGLELATPKGFPEVGPPIYAKWVLYYYASHLRRVADPSFIVDVSGFARKKMEAIGAYRSQFEANPKNRGVPGWIEASMRYFGSRIGTEAGEPFWSREPLGLCSLGGLVM
ncbi:MAG: PIG-L family deacetylase [Phycisphaeraceae bacterium]|nr:PIG-L family deacetylase [Phycisphaeraceae bacterium]